MLYFFYQPAPKTPWVPALASQRAAILKEKNPALCTVLDVDSVFDPGTTADEAAADGNQPADIPAEAMPTRPVARVPFAAQLRQAANERSALLAGRFFL